MLHQDPRFSAAVTEAVAVIERTTDAEVVVVVAPRSGRYRDVGLIAALAGGLFTLCALAWSPWTFADVLFPVYVALAAAVAGGVAVRSPGLARRIAGERRMRLQVRESAEAAFIQESVHGTKRRTGVLVYVSLLERRVEVLPDHGLLGRVAGTAFADLDIGCGTLEELLAGLTRLGELLAANVPAIEAENANEIADEPRVRG